MTGIRNNEKAIVPTLFCLPCPALTGAAFSLLCIELHRSAEKQALQILITAMQHVELGKNVVNFAVADKPEEYRRIGDPLWE